MNATEFCELVEMRLGWEIPHRANRPRWKQVVTEAAKVNRKQAENPSLYTWTNLQLAVELLRREKKSRSPVGVFAHVQRALDLALDDESDLEYEIRKVVTYEEQRGDPDGWAVRFARATGPYRRRLLDEWRESV